MAPVERSEPNERLAQLMTLLPILTCMSSDSTQTSSPRSPSQRDRVDTHRSPVTKLVALELLDADAPLTEADLRERTLLPAQEVRLALADLKSRGLCTARDHRVDGEIEGYVLSLSADSGS